MSEPRELTSADFDVLEKCRYIGSRWFKPGHEDDYQYG